ncbi:hypothetical protein [Micromonospora sp. CPCC 205547]|uniref:hypothetical protein n=1 Tax=Micromonospora sp. CPCC 205547 TaxID=3122400 RepID=UPI003B967FFC
MTADVANRTDPADDGPRPFPAAAGSAPDSRPAPARDSEESRPTPGAALWEPDGGSTTTAPAATAGGPDPGGTATAESAGTGRAWPPTAGSSWERDAGTPWEPETETPWVPEAETPWTPDAEPPWDDADPTPTTGGGWRDEPDVQRVRPADAARLERLDAEVQVIDGRPRYHLFSCVHLIGREHEALPVSEAVSLGFTPCARCAPATTLLADAFPG